MKHARHSYARSERVGEQMHRELARLVATGIKHPTLAHCLRRVTFTGVEVSADYAHAVAFYTVLGSEEEDAQVAHALATVSGFLRRSLAHSLTLRHVPELHFRYDGSVVRGARLSQLIDEAVKDLPRSDADTTEG